MLTLAAWLHDLDPFLLKFPDGWPLGGLRWYGLSYLAAFALAWWIVRRVVKAGRSPLPLERVSDFVMFVAVAIIVGGRLGYVLFYDPALFGFVDGPPYWGVLAINRGGMASHGGMIGGLIGCWWFARRNGVPALHLFDLMAFAAPLGIAFGRLANFVNGELYGRAVSEDSPLAVKFPQELTQAPPEVAVAHYAGQVYAPSEPYDPLPWLASLVDRVQGLAGPEAEAQAKALVEPWLTARHPSQLYAAALEGLATFVVLLIVFRGPVKPGVVAAWFAMTYAVMRVVNEFYRLPDEGLGLQAGLSRGQWLSVALFVAGAVVWRFAVSRKVGPVGGWLPTNTGKLKTQETQESKPA